MRIEGNLSMKKIAVTFLLLLTVFAASAQTKVLAPDSVANRQSTDSIVAYAKSFLGSNYTYGAASPKGGFDCSGFTWFVFNHFGITVPRSAKDYKNFGKEIEITQARKGDIIVFRGTHAGDKSAGHVGIVISEAGQPLQFIHASSSKNHRGVVITDYIHSNYPKRFIKIVRVVN